MKLYQAVIYSIPICLSLIILFIYYVIYLCRRRSNVDWFSLNVGSFYLTNNLPMIDIGLHEDLRGMLPIVIFGESFTVKDSQCSVCLEHYQTGQKLQQIPACGHTFHMECISTWLTSHFTCPLCRISLSPECMPQDRSHQTPDIVPSMENSNAGVSAELESISEIEIHIEDAHEGNRDIREVI